MPASTMYARIEEAIATEIARGGYHPGNQLPTEDALLRPVWIAIAWISPLFESDLDDIMTS